MAVKILPLIAHIDSVQHMPRFRNQVNRSAWSGTRKVMALPGGESFAFSVGCRPVYSESAARAWRAFILSLRGVENHFNLPLVFKGSQFPLATANPTVASAVAGNSFATLNGIPTGGLKAGMWLTFTLADATKQAVVVLGDTAAGNQTVAFEPSLRRNASGAVEAKVPFAEVAMVSDNTGWNDQNGELSVAFDCEEAWG